MTDMPSAVITGASSGIGAACAINLARLARYRLLLCGRNRDRLASVARQCRDAGSVVEEIEADLETYAGVDKVAEAVRASTPLELLVNNAGSGTFGPTTNYSDSAWDKTIAINVTATFRLCRAAIGCFPPYGGTIVNISSDADTTGFSEAAAYCAAKGGVLLLSRALREEFRPKGIRVCVISPGRVDTGFNGKQPGMRPGALAAADVAEVVAFAATCSANIELTEIRMDSMRR